MVRRLTYVFFLVAAFLLPVSASAEVVRNFESDIAVSAAGTIQVVETITYDFEGDERHGIYRDIPVRYATARGAYAVRLSGIAVTDENDEPYEFIIERLEDGKRIKIGDPDVLISGRRVYRISYAMDRAIGFFDTHDELYWNVTGDAWNVTIEQAKARVLLPGAVYQGGDLGARCFRGYAGETRACVSTVFDPANPTAVSFSDKNLAPGQGLTIVAAVPAGTVARPTRLDEIKFFLTDNWVVGIPAAIFVILLFVWNKYGRDAKGRGTVIPEYDVPDNLLPSQVGGLLDNTVHPRDLSADIIELAILGYVKITRVEKSGMFGKDDFRLEQVKPGTTLENPILKKLLTALFAGKVAEETPSVLVSSLKNTFYKDARALTKDIFSGLVREGYMTRNPHTIRAIFIGLAIIIGGFLGNLLAAGYGPVGIGSGVVSAIIIFAFGIIMPARTKKGAEALEKILGLKMYLTVAEKDRIAFHNAPEKSPEVFEKFLPYAMVMKVEKAWAKQFEGINMPPPRWYGDSSLRAFSAGALAGSLSDFKTASGSAMSSAPSGGSGLSGGGSGGGMGGGGGGSW